MLPSIPPEFERAGFVTEMPSESQALCCSKKRAKGRSVRLNQVQPTPAGCELKCSRCWVAWTCMTRACSSSMLTFVLLTLAFSLSGLMGLRCTTCTVLSVLNAPRPIHYLPVSMSSRDIILTMVRFETWCTPLRGPTRTFGLARFETQLRLRPAPHAPSVRV